MEQKKDPRKDFRKRSFQFFLIGLVVAFSSTLVAFEWRTSEYYTPPDLPVVGIEIEEVEPPIRIFVKKPPSLPTPPKVAPQPDPVPDPVPAPMPDPDPNPKPEPIIKFVDPGFEPEPFVPEVVAPVKWAEKMPMFKGGEPALYAYLAKNIKYPKFAMDQDIEAKLFVEFIVNTDGSISDVKVLRGEGYGFDEEAARVIKEMPNWIPGQQGGKKVRVIYVIPINFALM